MKTLAILAQKGGAGKSTIAVHLVVCAARSGIRTALIDLDPQASASRWNASRPEANQLDIIQASAEALPARIAQARQGGCRLLIIDTAPHSDRAAAVAASLADLLLIPCRPARFDLDAIAATLEIARIARTPAHVVLNAVPPRSRIGLEAGAGLKHQGAQVCPVHLHQRAAYGHAVIDGRAVHEYEPGGKAAQEIDQLYAWITTRLKLRIPR